MAKNKGAEGNGATKSIRSRVEAQNAAKAGIVGQRNNRKQRRQAERADGTFYVRVNAERSNDLLAVMRGETGSYAYPGNNQPSVHFSVHKEVGKQGAMSVIRIESIQHGHELENEVFDEKIFVPTFYIEKFGRSFSSRFDDRLSASTQELICHYLARELTYYTDFIKPEEHYVETFDEKFSRTSDDIKSMLHGVVDLYGLTTANGKVILAVFMGKRPNINVVDSTDVNIVPSRVYIPVQCIFYDKLDQVTDDESFTIQQALHAFLQNNLGDLIDEVKAVRKKQRQELRNELVQLHSQALEAGVEAIEIAGTEPQGKAAKKQTKKTLEKLAKQKKLYEQMLAVESMRNQAVGLREAANGKMGYVVMTNAQDELIVLFSQIGADKVIQVVHMNHTHLLKKAGVTMETKVYVGQLIHGEIDIIDMANHKMTMAEVKASNALISHIRGQMDKIGVKLHTKRTNLRLVKQAA